MDGTFAFFSNLTFATYFAKTQNEGVDRQDTSYRAQMEYAGDRYGLQLERLTVDPNFNPEVGFLRRSDMRKNYGLVRFSPRPKANKTIRKYLGIGQFTYIEDAAGRLTTRLSDGEFDIDFQNSDRFILGVQDDYELVTRAFSVVPGARIGVGGYDFVVGRIGYNFGQQRPFSGNLLLERGEFYDGEPDRRDVQPLPHQPVARGSRLSRASRSTGSTCPPARSPAVSSAARITYT